jgi:hypothetical protein
MENIHNKTGAMAKKFIAVLTVFLFVGMTFFTACQNALDGGEDVAAELSAKSASGIGATITITTQAQLESIGTTTAYPANGDYLLGGDLILMDYWPPCDTGAEQPAFTGTFDGGGNTITISSFDSDVVADSAYLGIFAVSAAGVAPATLIQNLNVVFDATSVSSSTVQYVGGVVAYSTSTTFDTINVSGSLNATNANTSTDPYYSFYVGEVTAYAATSTFTNIVVSGSINATGRMPLNSDYTNYNFVAVGGVVGYAAGGSISGASAGTTITATGTQVQSHAGGIVGRADSFSIARVTGTGNVTANGENNNTSAGGIAGYITQTTVASSHTTAGNITVTAPSGSGQYDVYQAFAGGLIGFTGNASAVTLSSAIGQTVAANNASYPYAGGLVGYNYGMQTYPNPPTSGSTITQSYSTNVVSADATNDTNPGLPYAGGLVAYNSATGSLIENCYATGSVSAVTSANSSWAGGLVGANAQGAVVSKSYATGNVVSTAGTGDLPYGAQAGANVGAAGSGIVGTNYYSNTSTTPTTTTIVQFCAALNSLIDGSASTGAPYLLHRVAGDLGTTASPAAPGTLNTNIANEYMTVTPEWNNPDKTLNGVDGEDEAAQPAQNIYTGILGWDFSAIWTMNGSGYPSLIANP